MRSMIYTDGEYLEKNPDWHAGDSPLKARQILKLLDKSRIHPKSICEVGCGSGEILCELYRSLPDDVCFSGYEISPQALAIAQKKETGRLKFFSGSLPLSGAPFYDLILCIDVLEHVEDYYTFLRALWGKGKIKIFHIPLAFSVASVLRISSIMEAWEQVGHIHIFSRETALQLLKDTGYRIMDSFYTEKAVNLVHRNRRQAMARYPRRILFRMHPDFAVRLLGGFSLMVLAT